MQALENATKNIEQELLVMPREELRRVERALRRLYPEQINFVRETLERARLEDSISSREFRFLEYFFEKWWTHSLPTKLAIIARVTSLSDTGIWPGTLPDRGAAGAYAGVNQESSALA